MIISKLVVGNDLVFFKNEKTKSNLNIKFIKSSLKSVQYWIHNSRKSKIKISLNCVIN